MVREAQKKMVNDNSSLIMGTDFPYEQHCVKKSTAIFGGPNNRIHLNAIGLSQAGRDIAKNIKSSDKIK